MEVVLNAVDHCVDLVAAFNYLKLENCSFLGVHCCFNELVFTLLGRVENVYIIAEVHLLDICLVLNVCLELGLKSCVIDNSKLGSKGCLNCLAISILNGSGELILNLFRINVRKVDGPEALLGAFLYLNVLVVCLPGYFELGVANYKLSGNVIIVSQNLTVLVLHHCVEQFFCIVKSSSICIIAAAT